MPHKPRQFVNGEIYHIVIKRTGEEKLFLDMDDHYRGIFCTYELNNAKATTIRERRLARIRFKKSLSDLNRGSPPVNAIKTSEVMVMKDERDLLTEVLAFCFMPNHVHLLVRELKEGGISKFMLKLESGYAAYFKQKYGVKMTGHFFQDRFKCVHIKTEEQLIVVFVYIHTNPIALIEPGWKERGIKNPEKAIKFLEEKYRWSSFFDYIGRKNFPSVTQRDFLLEMIGGPEGAKRAVEDWIRHKRYKGKINEFPDLALE